MTVEAGRLCAWDRRPIRPDARADSIYCGTPCRQAAHRFARGRRRREATTMPYRFGYADPPYPGTSKKYYAGHPDYAGEVDHARLIAELEADFPGGWALSTSASSLQRVLELCSAAGILVRVAAWVRGERPADHYEPLSAWEPVIVRGGRPYLSGPQPEQRRTDALVYISRPRRTDVDRVTGAKPAEFAWWLFDLLGALPGDELVDVFPGSGGIARAWAIYQDGPPTLERAS